MAACSQASRDAAAAGYAARAAAQTSAPAIRVSRGQRMRGA
jgi:hypothetical protein